MLISIIITLGLGFLGGQVAKYLKLPSLVGMLIVGIIIGPYSLNLLSSSFLSYSQVLRDFALIVILIRAGLSLNLSDLKAIGLPALMMAFIPATLEILGVVILAPLIFKISFAEAALLGGILAAVSPAVVIPRMIKLVDEGYGTDKKIPQLIMAGASVDDIYVIVLFSSFLSMNTDGIFNMNSLVLLPVELILGVMVGAVVGIFITQIIKRLKLQPLFVVGIILAFAFMLVSIEKILPPVTFSAYLACLSMGVVIYSKLKDKSNIYSQHFNQIWRVAEIFLFVLVGVSVSLASLTSAAPLAALLIIGALMFRALGVWLSLLPTNFNSKEKLFAVLAYSPKATVQAALGALPLAAGLASGSLMLNVSVVSILLCAPLGALLIDLSYKKLLSSK